MTGFSLVPCVFLLIAASSAMTGYFPVLAELLKSLLNKLRETTELPATDLATDGAKNAEEVVAVAAARRAKLNTFIVVRCVDCNVMWEMQIMTESKLKVAFADLAIVCADWIVNTSVS
jgi:hypothetical protein